MENTKDNYRVSKGDFLQLKENIAIIQEDLIAIACIKNLEMSYESVDKINKYLSFATKQTQLLIDGFLTRS